MKTYTPPTMTDVGPAADSTADSRENNTNDTFFSLNGPQPGQGGSFDTCVTPNNEECL